MRIPDASGFGEVVSDPVKLDRRQTTAEAFGGGIGRAVQNIGMDMQREADLTRDAADRANAVRTVHAARDGLSAAHDEITELVRTGDLPKEEAATRWQERSREISESMMAGVPPKYLPDTQADIESQNARFTRGVQKAILQRDQSDVRAGIESTLEAAQRLFIKDPAAARTMVDQSLEQFGPHSGMSPVDVQKTRQVFEEKSLLSYFDSHGTAAMARGDLAAIQGYRERLQGDEGEPLDPARRAAMVRTLIGYEHQVIADTQRKTAEGRFDFNSRVKDVQSMVMGGVTPPQDMVPTLQEAVALHGVNGAAIWQQEVGNFLEVGGALQQMRQATPADRDALIAAAAPDAGPGYAAKAQMREALIHARGIVEKQMADDPAAYAMANSARVQRAAQVMSQVLTDPAMPAEDKVAATDFYARTAMAEQLRLGVDVIRDERPGNKARGPRLLTNQQANSISDMFNSPITGGANAAMLVQSLESQWGKYWPTVFGQLAADNKLPPAALVIPNMQSDGSRSRMAQASTMKPEELKSLLASSDPKDIRDKLLSQFDIAQSTFVAQGADGNRTLSLVIGEAEKLAQLYRSQGKSVGESASQAYTEVMGWKYEFADTYRVPKTHDFKAVAIGTQEALRDIKADGVAVFQGGAPTIVSEDAIRYRSMWVTNGDESGLRLMLRGADGGIYAIKSKDGAHIEFKWEDLTRRAAKLKSDPTLQRERDIEELRRRQQELNPRR